MNAPNAGCPSRKRLIGDVLLVGLLIASAFVAGCPSPNPIDDGTGVVDGDLPVGQAIDDHIEVVEDSDFDCSVDVDCDDGLFCNGEEVCDGAVCHAGTPPCPDTEACAACIEEDDACLLLCISDEDCDDDDLCTADACDLATCQCVHALVDCDDDIFCNGLPYCDYRTGECLHRDSSANCAPIGPCDEGADQCIDAFDSDQCVGISEDPASIDVGLSFEAALDYLRDPDMPSLPCIAKFDVFVATCEGSGLSVLAVSAWLYGGANFYDPTTGDFLGRRSWTDLVGEPCWGKSFWPVPVDCTNAAVTEVICGTVRTVGDVVNLRSTGWLFQR